MTIKHYYYYALLCTLVHTFPLTYTQYNNIHTFSDTVSKRLTVREPCGALKHDTQLQSSSHQTLSFNIWHICADKGPF